MRTYVLAKNYQHFRYWCISNGFNPNSLRVRYVDSVRTLQGLSLDDETEIVFYETWGEHPQALELLDEVRRLEAYRDATPIGSPQVMEETNGIFTALFWKRAIERMVRVLAYSLTGIVTTTTLTDVNFGWKQQLLTVGVTVFGSLLGSIIGSKVGDNPNDPSFFNQATKEVTDGKATST